jgi:hypothetical protein
MTTPSRVIVGIAYYRTDLMDYIVIKLNTKPNIACTSTSTGMLSFL